MELILKSLLYLIFFISLLTGMNGIIGGAAAIPGVTDGVGAAIDNYKVLFKLFLCVALYRGYIAH